MQLEQVRHCSALHVEEARHLDGAYMWKKGVDDVMPHPLAALELGSLALQN